MHDDTDSLPADLAKPRPEPWDASTIAGVVVGGVMLVITVAGLIYAVTL
ncbi:hypothetical protein QDA11_gp48 [Microbacterium phage Jayden]|uniref:Uncharacterized protein n=1 Tax=Microbacterium phage Jayden TaxID=2656550 RepID=A0A649VSH6_9CAUD|nr:hypothetical protein QDA11_gp48 [Microbacterium phage Jayden]QGJ95268.1 hypothetical protein PBI_JAYDEN_48 [Microbacterium phage Jayden]